MKHKTVRRKLLRYLDNELEQDELKSVRLHLSSCPECNNYLKQLEKIWLTGQHLSQVEVPPFLWTRLSVRLESETEVPVTNQFYAAMKLFMKKALIPTAIVITIFSGILFGSEMHKDNLKGNRETTIMQDFGFNYFSLTPPGYVGENLVDFNATK
ncbi:MAG: zf-HC2 domain-containing protein [Prolixibacteraceae bacterium]|nr:zf-HC2 domain-containing protein [Prolixibacteraceae bacterium]